MRGRVGFVQGSLLLFLLGFSNGCYVYKPLTSAPVPGSIVSFLVTDVGRVGLAASAGPSAQKLEGVVQSENDSAYVLSMRSVTYANGQINQWSGEKLVVGKQYVTNARERSFSKSRTALVTVGVAAALFGFIYSRGLFGLGSESDKAKGEDPGGSNQ
jgi:hypothetical protein